MSKNKQEDDRKQLLIRYRIDKKGCVSYIDPCCDEIPAALLGIVMEAFSMIEKDWNNDVARIKNGQKFLCTETVIMDDFKNTIAYRKGDVYISENNRCITDIQGDKEHKWYDYSGHNGWNRHFELINS